MQRAVTMLPVVMSPAESWQVASSRETSSMAAWSPEGIAFLSAAASARSRSRSVVVA